MRPRWLWAGGVAAGALVWAAAPELRWPARALTAVLLGPAPVAFILQAGGLDLLPRPLPRIRLYVGTIIGLWLLALLTIAIAGWSGFTGRLLGLHVIPSPLLLLWTCFALLAASAIVVAFKAFGHRDDDIMREMVPADLSEQAVFVLLSVSAGICEELAFRGFLFAALVAATSSVAAAVVLSSAVFGVMHVHQGAGGALRAALLGTVLCVPVILSGSIYPSMAAHALADIAGGIWLARWLLR